MERHASSPRLGKTVRARRSTIRCSTKSSDVTRFVEGGLGRNHGSGRLPLLASGSPISRRKGDRADNRRISKRCGVSRDVSKADLTLTKSANAANISVTDILHETKYARRCDGAVDASGVSHPAGARGWRTAWLRHHARRE